MNRLEQDVPSASLPALVDGAAARFGERTLWSSIDDGARISFGDFAGATLQCANALNALGIGSGTLDDAKRRDLLAHASEIAMDDVAVMPLYFYSFSIASPKSISYAPRLDQFTVAYNARRTK